MKVSETETVKVIMTWMMDGTLSGTNILLLEFRPNVLARDASNGPIHSPAPFPLLSGGITSGGRQEGLIVSRFKAEGPRLDSASAVLFFFFLSEMLWFVDTVLL